MKEKLVIGRLFKRSFIIIQIVLYPLFGWIFYTLIMNSIKNTTFITSTPYALMQMKIALIVILIVGFIMAIPGYGTKQIISIDHQRFRYCSAEGLIAKYQQFINILFNQEQNYEVNIALNDIKKITLIYSDIYMLWSQKGHSIIFNIDLKDGTLMKIQPDNLYLDKKNCLEGIEFMEKCGIQVNDPYHLKDALRNEEISFAEYIEKVRKDNED
ncbi:hypothetical protein [Candidatus Stoquefichus massiliensis]|uniref:hypothetical protein n=1 Tax=Candidatus Stoquefichus massiliensis TaxID=1470350 RepID=UPI0004B021D7|nr:hypothetical protein [Candidatus Stoquefichus massiliensis]